MTSNSVREVQVIRDALWDVILKLKARAFGEYAADDEAEYTDAVAGVLIWLTDKLRALPDLIDDDYRQVADDAVTAWQAGTG